MVQVQTSTSQAVCARTDLRSTSRHFGRTGFTSSAKGQVAEELVIGQKLPKTETSAQDNDLVVQTVPRRGRFASAVILRVIEPSLTGAGEQPAFDGCCHTSHS